MQGRIDHKIDTENKLLNKIKNYPKYITEFYYYLNLKSHTTKKEYINNVLRFLNYLNEDIIGITPNQLDDINAFKIQEYISNINYYEKDGEMKEIKSSTKAIIYSSLNSFFNFLYYNKYITSNPFIESKIERPKIQENDITFLTPDEVKIIENNILKCIGKDIVKSRQEIWKYRDLLLFRIPVITGIRVTALSEININDINFKNKTITVTEKGNITKKINIDEKTKEYLVKWLINRKDILDEHETKAVFISNRKERLTVRSIENIISKYTYIIPNKHITPHKLRSTCGTNLYQAKKDVYLVSNVLGHKSTVPTKRYVKVFDEDKKDAINTLANLYE